MGSAWHKERTFHPWKPPLVEKLLFNVEGATIEKPVLTGYRLCFGNSEGKNPSVLGSIGVKKKFK